MPAMLFDHRREGIAPEGTPTNPSLHLAGAGHARDAFLPTRTEEHHALGRSYSAFAPIPNPHRIPERVVAHAFHQPCPDGIGDQITRGSPHGIVIA